MPADEVTHGTDVDESRVRTGPRHAAPRKPLFTRFHMPAGKAIAMAAMPTAVIMGMGFTSSLALADSGGSATTNSQKANEYKDCVAALDGSSASPSPSASASSSPSADKATPSLSASGGTSKNSPQSDSGKTSSGSSDSGSGDKATPKPSASASKSSGGDTATPTPSVSASSSGGGGLLDSIGNTLGEIFTGGGKSTPSASPTPSASSTPSAGKDSSSSSSSSSASGSSVSDTVKGATKKVTDTVNGTVKDTTKAADSATKAVQKAAGSATSSASPSPSSSTDAANCQAATKDVGGVDNKVPVPDDPWYLSASSLTLSGADYQGVVEVRTASGATKKVLKYVISDGTKIGDLHQTVKDKQQGKTYHVQAAKGSTSTITGGTTTMYTESISGNLLGLIPLTFTPDSPPPLNIPFIYFTNVKVVQAAQFGGNLHVPGMHVYTTDGTG